MGRVIVFLAWYFVMWFYHGRVRIHSVCETWPEAMKLSFDVGGWYSDERGAWAALDWEAKYKPEESKEEAARNLPPPVTKRLRLANVIQ